MLIDTHSHIDLGNFEDHFDKVIETAKEYGVASLPSVLIFKDGDVNLPAIQSIYSFFPTI